MAIDQNQNIPMPGTQGGCRQWGPAADETGAGPASGGGNVWVYGDPARGTAPSDSAGGPVPNSLEDTAAPAPMAGGRSLAPDAAQQERMRNPVSMACTHRTADVQDAYKASLRSLLDRNLGYFIVATFQIGSGQSVSWQGILHSVGSDYLVLYQPDYDRYISCDLYSLKFAQFHNVKGVPYCAGSQCWQGRMTF